MKIAAWIAAMLWLLAIGFLHQIDRSDFLSYWGVYSIAFATYFCLLFYKKINTLRTGLVLAFLARLISFFFEPLLSDDYFRFIWDGMVSHSGIHPMAFTPQYLVLHPDLISVDPELYSQLNSKTYYSVYPPLAQGIFRLSYLVNGLHIEGHILFYKFLLILTDTLIVFLLYRLLRGKGLSGQHTLWYALNPLIIMEYTGNLHMDGLMIAGLLGAVYLSQKNSMTWSIVSMIASISLKMVSFILIPFMPRGMYWKKIILFGLLSSGGTILLFMLSFGSHTGWLQSLSLWFRSFEFNASMYYLARAIGFWVRGYNTIDVVGPLMALITVLGVGVVWIQYLRRKIIDWSTAMLAVMTIYFLMSTTVHPWYLGLIVVLGILSQNIYPLVWTFLVALSYSHYAANQFEENYWLIATEYILLFLWMIFEWRRRTIGRENQLQT